MISDRPVLAGVSIAATDPASAAAVLEQIIGMAPQQDSGGTEFAIGTSRLRLQQGNAENSGLIRIAFSAPSLKSHLAALRLDGVPVISGNGRVVVPRAAANGIDVTFEQRAEATNNGQPTPRAWLDHVALVVADLPAAAQRWSVLLGQPRAELVPHPLGGADTARFLLGEQMIELVSPWPSANTAMRRRLDATGDGPIALALIPQVLGEAIAKLSSSGVPLLDQPPHIFIHPKSAGGVLVQLTPRLEHPH